MPSGERWAFSRYESRFDIRRDAQRIFFDALVLEPHIDSVVERMGRFDVLLTAVVHRAARRDRSRRIS